MAGNTDFWILSDGDEIPVSRSRHYNLGLNYDLPDYVFSVEGYYKRNIDITEYTLRYQQNRIPGPGPMPGPRPVGEILSCIPRRDARGQACGNLQVRQFRCIRNLDIFVGTSIYGSYRRLSDSFGRRHGRVILCSQRQEHIQTA